MHSGTLWSFHQQSSHNFHDEHRRSPCDLTLLNAAGDVGVDPYAQYTLFTVLEFGPGDDQDRCIRPADPPKLLTTCQHNQIAGGRVLEVWGHRCTVESHWRFIVSAAEQSVEARTDQVRLAPRQAAGH